MERAFPRSPKQTSTYTSNHTRGLCLADDEDCLDIDTGPFTLEEVQAAIKHLKNGKRPGIDGIDAEMLQVEPVLAAGY